MAPLSPAPSGRRVLVTGAAGGIGRAIVEALAACDCQVAACDVTDAVPAVTGAAASAVFDVRDRAATGAGVASAVEQLGGCDAVVANAGVVDTIHRAERFPEAEWRKDIETNLSGQFHVAQAAFEYLRAAGDGRIVLISSAAAETGVPGQVAYSAAKAGSLGLARTLAGEWAGHGIHTNVVMPGFIGTPKVRALPEPLRQGLEQMIPLGRMGLVEELAGAVAFLLSPAAGYLNGAVIRVDGGFGLSTGGLMTGPKT
ncbi:MAG TPA: SDR family NAD(P)-dependent oxidoreductase [Solirubrobacteraceae bacterium]|nr:SDR family NAD(P)-dependent oxidoreductase [Solirubrobacteraceae bacterium]